jgi:ribosomal protein S27AE
MTNDRIREVLRAIALLKSFTDEERSEVFAEFCPHCGCVQPEESEELICGICGETHNNCICATKKGNFRR